MTEEKGRYRVVYDPDEQKESIQILFDILGKRGVDQLAQYLKLIVVDVGWGVLLLSARNHGVYAMTPAPSIETNEDNISAREVSQLLIDSMGRHRR